MWFHCRYQLISIVLCLRLLPALLTRSLDEPRVGVVRNDGNGQIPQVEFERPRNDVDVLIGRPWDVCLLAICEEVRVRKDKWRPTSALGSWQYEVREQEKTAPLRGWRRGKSSAALQSSSYQPPGLVPSASRSAGPAFQRGRGLLVQAVRTSQRRESEWHSVTDDLPHGNLSETLARRCGPPPLSFFFFFCLAVKIHTALEQDKLILNKSAARRRTFCFFSWRRRRFLPLLCIPAGSSCVSVLWKPCVAAAAAAAACQDKIYVPRWTVIPHKCQFLINPKKKKNVRFAPWEPNESTWGLSCQCCVRLGRQKSITQSRWRTCSPLSNAIFTSSTESLNPDTL